MRKPTAIVDSAAIITYLGWQIGVRCFASHFAPIRARLLDKECVSEEDKSQPGSFFLLVLMHAVSSP